MPAPRVTPEVAALRSRPSARAGDRVHEVRRRLGTKTLRQLVADYKSGQPTTALMRQYNLGKGTVVDILHKHAVPMRRQSVSAADLPGAIELYRSGWSLARISNHLGYSSTAVRHGLLAAGVRLRARWERGPQ